MGKRSRGEESSSSGSSSDSSSSSSEESHRKRRRKEKKKEKKEKKKAKKADKKEKKREKKEAKEKKRESRWGEPAPAPAPVPERATEPAPVPTRHASGAPRLSLASSPKQHASGAPRLNLGQVNRVTAGRVSKGPAKDSSKGFEPGWTSRVSEHAAVAAATVAKSKAFKPMTAADYAKQQAVVREVVDPFDGRTRLVKGSGEIIERIVTRDAHLDINKQATRGDGMYFAKKATSQASGSNSKRW